MNTKLQELRAQEKWQSIWQIISSQIHQVDSIDSTTLAEGAYALVRMKKYDEGESIARKVLQVHPSLLANRAMVLVLLHKNKSKEALSFAQSVFSPPYSFANQEEAAQAIVALAAVHKQMNEFDKVRALIAEAVRLFPVANAYFLLGTMELSANNFEKGVEALEMGLNLDPKSPELWCLLGNTYYQLNDINSMLNTFNLARKYHPKNTNILLTLGEMYTRLHRPDEAKQFLKNAVAYEPENAAAWINYANFLYKQHSPAEECAIAYKKAIELAPKNAELLFNLGQLYFKDEELRNNGLILMQEAYKIAPENGTIAISLAEAYVHLNLQDEADALINSIPSSYQNTPLILRSKANIADMRGQYELGLKLKYNALNNELWLLKRQSTLSLFGDGSPPPMDVYDASETLLTVCQFLEHIEVPYFLSVGTLLGIIREGALLPHDKDTDLGISWDIDREWLIQKFEQSDVFEICRGTPSLEKALWNFSVFRKGTPIGVDFFFHKPDGDDWLMGFNATPTPWLIRFKQRKLTTVEYKGHLLPIPENPEGYLEEVYGPDWRIPMPSYDTVIAASNLCPESYFSTKIIGYDRLYEALMNRSWKKVLWYCEALKRFDNPPILDELAGWLRDAMPQKSDKVL